MLGYGVDEVEGTQFDWLLSETDRPRLQRLIAGDGSGSTEAHTLECSLTHKDGTTLRFEVQHTDLLHDEHVRGIVLNSRDVSERKEFEEQLAHQAFHDPVTNLANRALFSDRVEHALMRSQRGFPDIAVVFIDLDDFKTVNDSLGHAAGDQVLQEVARRLRIAVRPTDTVARFGGDEFAVLLESVNDSSQAADAAARILHALELPYEIDGKQVFPRASIGICLVDREDSVPEAAELLRNADVAMYMAKRDSKGSYRVFEPAMHERVVERLELRAELQQAIEADQLELHYQPVVRLDGARDPRRRGAAALAAPDARHDPAEPVHPARRGDRPDHLDGPLGPERGLPRGRRSSRSASSARSRSRSASTSRCVSCSRTRSSTTCAARSRRAACRRNRSCSRSPSR